MPRRTLLLAVIASLVMPWIPPAEAVVVVPSKAGLESTGLDPIHAPFLANVGCFPGKVRKSAVYIGRGKVVTAMHVYVGREDDSVWIDGTEYRFDKRLTVQIRERNGRPVDLVVIQLSQSPPLPEIPLADSPPFMGERVVLAGFGVTRDGGEKFWTPVAGGPGKPIRWNEFQPAAGDNFVRGYEEKSEGGGYRSGATWGENVVAARNLGVRAGAEATEIRAFGTIFDVNGLPREAQAGTGDSGGAVFIERGGGWQLAGIIHAVGPGKLPLRSLPEEAAVHGMATYAADVSHYRSQILNPIPEPRAALLLCVALAALVLGRRRAV